MSWSELEYLGNPLTLWAVAAVVTVLTFVGLEWLKGFVSHRLARLASRTDNEIDDIVVLMLRATKAGIVAVVAIYVGTLFVALPAQA
ncbi:MAG: mechanosensitive ion channel family protein, partial [Deltaproteobacteria bacterium]